MKITNRHNLPAPIVQALTADEYDYPTSPDQWRVHELAQPPRITLLMRRHRDDIEVDVSERFWLMLGIMAHKVMEAANADALTEERLEVEVIRGVRLSGKFDHLSLFSQGRDTYRLIDWKVTSTYAVKNGIKPEWETQSNLYRLLLEWHGFAVDSMEIWAILRDHGPRLTGFSPIPFKRLPVDIWGLDAGDNYAALAVSNLREWHASGKLPECTPDDRWEDPPQWALMRKGRKSAVSLCSSFEIAQARLEEQKQPSGHYIEYRAPEPTRCLRYCPARTVCEQGKALVAEYKKEVGDE